MIRSLAEARVALVSVLTGWAIGLQNLFLGCPLQQASVFRRVAQLLSGDRRWHHADAIDVADIIAAGLYMTEEAKSLRGSIAANQQASFKPT